MTYRKFLFYDTNSNSIDFEEYYIDEPKQCMHCRETGMQIELGSFKTLGEYDKFCGISLYICQLCESTSIHYLTNLGDFESPQYSVTKSLPTLKEKIFDMSPEFTKQFPSFHEIYIQAYKAEQEELDQIAGMGYRKSLEFLVTDYLKSYSVEDITEEWLENPKTSLSDKISKIESTRIKDLARAISYLGNDETHYSRRHPEYDINSIKAFIRALVSEIQNDIEYKRAVALINKPRT